jgi:uncharacterized protein HemX
MNPITQIMAIVLAISLAANAFLGHAYLGQRDKTATEAVQVQQVTTVAQECSKGTEDLAKQADQRQAAAAPKIAAAQQQAQARDKRADVILATPAATPGDDCRSAQARVDDWWSAHQPITKDQQ